MRRCGWALGLAVLAVGGCARGIDGLGERPALLVVPFLVGGRLDTAGHFVEGGGPTDAPDVGDRAARILSGALAADGLDVLAAPADTPALDGPAAAAFARARGADAAVVGVVAVYVEREGTAWAIRQGAKVAYDVLVVRAEDGAVVAADRRADEQRPVSDDVTELPTFLQSGGRWLTRAELLERQLAHTAARLGTALRGG